MTHGGERGEIQKVESMQGSDVLGVDGPDVNKIKNGQLVEMTLPSSKLVLGDKVTLRSLKDGSSTVLAEVHQVNYNESNHTVDLTFKKAEEV